MEQNKKISIITPVYDNGKEYAGIKWLGVLNICLENQIEQNFEWILVYDGVNDNCREQVKNFKKVKYFEIRERKGNWGNYCRDFGLKQAVGDYIVFIDQDNIIFENYLSELSYLLDQDKEIGFVLCSIYCSYAQTNRILSPEIMRGKINTLCCMYRKDVISIKGWWARKKGCGDEFSIAKDLIDNKIKPFYLLGKGALGIWNGIRYKYPKEIYPKFINYETIEQIAKGDDKSTRNDKNLWFSI